MLLDCRTMEADSDATTKRADNRGLKLLTLSIITVAAVKHQFEYSGNFCCWLE